MTRDRPSVPLGDYVAAVVSSLTGGVLVGFGMSALLGNLDAGNFLGVLIGGLVVGIGALLMFWRPSSFRSPPSNPLLAYVLHWMIGSRHLTEDGVDGDERNHALAHTVMSTPDADLTVVGSWCSTHLGSRSAHLAPTVVQDFVRRWEQIYAAHIEREIP